MKPYERLWMGIRIMCKEIGELYLILEGCEPFSSNHHASISISPSKFGTIKDIEINASKEQLLVVLFQTGQRRQ